MENTHTINDNGCIGKNIIPMGQYIFNDVYLPFKIGQIFTFIKWKEKKIFFFHNYWINILTIEILNFH